MASKIKTFQQMATEFGISRKTFAKYVQENEALMDALEEANWFPGQILFPVHQQIIIDFFGNPVDEFNEKMKNA